MDLYVRQMLFYTSKNIGPKITMWRIKKDSLAR